MTSRPPLVLLGGVPGAGKTTVLHRAVVLRPDLVVLDSHRQRVRLRRHLGGLPYPLYRPLVHLLHHVAVIVHLLRRAPGPVVVHDPATRPRFRWILARAARSCGRRPVLVMIDVGQGDALAGQVRRGRQVRRAFARHWERWVRLRRDLLAGTTLAEGWAEVRLTDRDRALADLLAVTSGPRPRGGRGSRTWTTAARTATSATPAATV